MVVLKTRAEIEKMRTCGQILARIRAQIKQAIKSGVTTDELDQIVAKLLKEEGAEASFLGYNGYPKNSCISVNEEVVHGIPGPRVINDGDIVGFDLGVFYDGYHTDSAWTFAVGEVTPKVKLLLEVTEQSLKLGIEKAKPGNRIGDISAVIQKYVESHGFGVVRDLVGHGIGQSIHEGPSIPNFGKAGTGPRIKEGMTICIEPMVNEGTWRVKQLSDGWTIVAGDGKASAHFEHTIAIGKNGPEILTALPGQPY
jgi:methionyl aminopeptidase